MAGRDSAKGIKNSGNSKVRRHGLVVVGGALGAFAAAAAMATGSVVTAAPAKADFEDLLDPIIQPLVTSLSDAIAGFDPAAATDLTSWTDSLLGSLNSLDVGAALPATAEPAAAAPASSAPPYDIPITVQEGTEPTVQASIDGGPDQTLLVDTGSSGLVIPWEDLGSSSDPLQALVNLFGLGIPTGISESGYSGGVDYIYLTYDNATVDYGDGALTTSNTPIDVEILSWPTSLSSGSPLDFQQFLADNGTTGILGIGDNTGGPTTSPLESYGGVLVDVPKNELIVEPAAPPGGDTVSGAPISSLYETVTTNGVTNGSAVSDDVDSGGVYGTIPSSLASDVGPESTITVYSSQGGTELYSYTVGSAGEAPTSTSGTSIDSGVEPFLKEPIYIDYTDNMMTFYPS